MALAELGDLSSEVTIRPAAVEPKISTTGGMHFRMRSRGDVFELFYQHDFAYVDFISNLEEELAVMAAGALQEVRRVREGQANMLLAKGQVPHSSASHV